MTSKIRLTATVSLFTLVGLAALVPQAQAAPFALKAGDHVSYIGNTMADRMQHHAWLETYLHALYPEHKLTFRNLGFSGDELKRRQRSQSFGSPDEWLTKTKADVIFAFFGRNEALNGEAGLPQFEKDLAETIDGMLKQQYNGKSAPRLVFFSPIAHEDLKSPHLPSGNEDNKSLALYTNAMKKVCLNKGVRFVDLFHPTAALYKTISEPLTMNGIHLLDHGNKVVAEMIIGKLFEKKIPGIEKEITRLREAVLDKNYHWFSRYRVVDGYNVYGGRSKLNWHGQSNADVMKREMEIFDVMTANRDVRVWAVARGSDHKVVDRNLPKELIVKTNKKGPLDAERHPYLSGEEGIKKMRIAKGMKVNLFADEKMFPELVNPVQVAVDTDGRLFVAVWPSYPHWNPTEPRKDRIICLPDEDANGVADKCLVWADELNSVTGFEFWGDGMLVAIPPEIWHLKDTDGDDKADYKVRMLQGVSSADTHHSANALVVGPGGWLYFSRGIFNVAQMETPTKLYRSGASGVHRFNPRTFEVEFHFPIGPNPHGNVVDQWGFQFVNDGTSGTGSYANIGKGKGYKKWFQKRMRPVAATGILSSSHFPESVNGNFLICNTITDLAVLQHEVRFNGADISAHEVEPVLISSDPNFRPTDVEIGGDGAIYVSDWCNVLIGHMQHNMRDPNRDHKHGRVYRVTYEGRPLVKRVKLKGKPINEVCNAFYAKENATRYRARLELSGRDSKTVAAAVNRWAAPRNVEQADDAQALLECLWVFEEHRMPNMSLLKRVFKAAEPRVRAAAIRTLGHWGGRVEGWEDTLVAAARDEANIVRAEAVKAAVEFPGLVAAEAVFEVANRPSDPEIDYVINYARGELNVDKIVDDAVRSGKKLSTAAEIYVLRNASVEDLLKFDRTEAVYSAILSRDNVPAKHLRESLEGLAKMRGVDQLDLLFKTLDEQITQGKTKSVRGLGGILVEQIPNVLYRSLARIEKLALESKMATARQVGYAAWITAMSSGDDAFLAATKSKKRLNDFLLAVPLVKNDKFRSGLYDQVRSLISQLPTTLKSEDGGSGLQQPGIKVDYFAPNPSNVAIETLARLTPKASGIVPEIKMNVPQRKAKDKFALRFSGSIIAPRSGTYTFWTRSDDGSRLYIGDKQIVNNGGTHGPRERSGKIELPAGSHPITVTYFDQGGGDALDVQWAGPGFKKRRISKDRLALGSGQTLHDVAIKALTSIPGHETKKFSALSSLIRRGRQRNSAISALLTIDKQHWPEKEISPLVDNLVGYLTEMPASFRTSGPALNAVKLAESLATKLSVEESRALKARLQNLDVRVIAIGTVPHRMIFDKEKIAVQAGKPVEFRFSNTDDMPHNFAITVPGALEEIGKAAEATENDPDAQTRHYIPVSKKILLASRLLQPGQTQALSFNVPKEPGIYPYVCTYPNHWRRMYGALYVVANLAEYQGNPEAYLAANPLEIKDALLKYNTRGHEWKFEELAEAVKPLPEGRSFEVGKELFKVANCVACHQLAGEGRVFGPDLAKLDEKKRAPDAILMSILDPSKDLEEKYQSNTFVLNTGRVIQGMITEENGSEFKVVVDPLAKAKPTVIKKSTILNRSKLPDSIMPKGLLDKLSREEILDLIAFVHAGGDKKHKLFHAHHHDH